MGKACDRVWVGGANDVIIRGVQVNPKSVKCTRIAKTLVFLFWNGVCKDYGKLHCEVPTAFCKEIHQKGLENPKFYSCHQNRK